MLFPIEISVRIQWDDQRGDGDPRDKLKRAIRKAYRLNDLRMSGYDSITVEKDDKNHPEEPGTPYIARLKTDKSPGGRTVTQVNNDVTRAVEKVFNHDLVGARIIVENDENSSSFGW